MLFIHIQSYSGCSLCGCGPSGKAVSIPGFSRLCGKSIVGKMLNAELLPVDSLECECWLESTLM